MKNLEGTLLEGRYEVQEKLDGGSMATVYRAFDRKDSQPVAIKVLREDLAIQPDFLHRFRKEADKLKRLQHTNIVRLWEFVQKRHFAFISMEFIEGGTLQHKISDLQGFPMPSDEIIDLFSDVCNGLSKAHSAGIIHCDLKPANIMLRKDGTAVLTDFGIAREVEGTATMEHFGTATYMSPEQVRGDDPSPQFDIYALGVILFQLITGGYKPFTGSRATITGNTSEKIRWEQIHLDTPSPRRRNKDITKEMEALIFMCLNKDPRKRPKTAQQLLQSLKDTKIYSANRKKTVIPEEVEIVPPSSPGKKIKKPSQNRNIFIALLTTVGILFIFFLSRIPNRLPAPAVSTTMPQVSSPTVTPVKTPTKSATPNRSATQSARTTQTEEALLSAIRSQIRLTGYGGQTGKLLWSNKAGFDIRATGSYLSYWEPINNFSEVENFILGFEVSWETTTTNAGCGVTFRNEQNTDGFAYYLQTRRLQDVGSWSIYRIESQYFQSSPWGYEEKAIRSENGSRNKYILIVDGSTATVYANDKLLDEVELYQNPQRGIIALTAWQGSGTTICDFSDIWLWELP